MMEADRLERQLRDMELRIDYKLRRIMAAQDDINAATQTILSLLTAVQAADAQLEADVAALAQAAANPTDTTALNAAVAQVSATQQALSQAVADVTAASPAAPAAPAAPQQ